MINIKKELEFKKISEFSRGTLYKQLVDAYSFDDNYKKEWDTVWKKHDDFFYDNLEIANKYAFITVLNGEAIGHISWDPRNKPDYVEIGHNCIITKYKKKGYGHLQLEEAIRRIKEYDDLKRIIVTTNELLVPARKNYESVGFVKKGERENKETPFSGKYIDYEIVLKKDYSNNLIENIDKIHTTEMGIARIKRNIGIENVIEYCRERILDENSNIYKKGKNWYCENDDVIITINSYTVITAHKK